MKSVPAILINSPEGPLGVFSNFFLAPLNVSGAKYQSVEHYFQAQKFFDGRIVNKIELAESASVAKDLSWSVDQNLVRSDWVSVRDGVMLRALESKCMSDEAISSTLKITWPMPILEDSLSDHYWGIGSDGSGLNTLGRLLALVRDKIVGISCRASPPPVQRASLVARPAHSQSSRFSFIGIDNWNPPRLLSREKFDLVSSDILRCLSIPRLARGCLTESGFLLPEHKCDCQRPSRIGFLRAIRDANPAVSMAAAKIALDNALDKAFDEKYFRYRWSDDVRTLFPTWANDFLQLLTNTFGSNDEPLIAIGSGPGEEAKYVWRAFGDRVTLIDVGERLVDNCQTQAPEARVLRRRAESLDGVPNQSIGLYCALRTFQSAYFDIHAALKEAKRILRPGGGIVLSVADGYMTKSGQAVSGQISGEGTIDFSLAATCLSEIATELDKQQFDEPVLRYFGSEWIITSRSSQ